MSDIFAKRLLYDSINLGTEYRPRKKKYKLETIVVAMTLGWVGGIFSGLALAYLSNP